MSTNSEYSGRRYDVIVIGGGPSGMMAAGHAAERGKHVLLIEKHKQLGKKLDITGGGRCNILNAEPDSRKLLANYGDAAKFLHSPFAQHGLAESREFFESRGLPIVVEARKRAFPASQDAKDVTALMRTYVNSNHVTLQLGTRVTGFDRAADGSINGVQTNKGNFAADAFILATGGASRPEETGASAEAVSWLTDFAHTVHEPNPNIVPLKVLEEWVKALSGTTLSFMKITFTDAARSKVSRFSRTGKLLFTHFGLSGPLILNAAHEVKQLLKRGQVLATIDLYPDTEVHALRQRVLTTFDQHKNKELRNILPLVVPPGMADAVAAQFNPELLRTRVHSVSKVDREALVDRLKAMPLTITGTMGMDWAVISDGGIDLAEIDTKTMQSKLVPNLFCTGDVLHINRPSGGFSLQLCWTTGWVAGEHC